jgi:hypothetical protein
MRFMMLVKPKKSGPPPKELLDVLTALREKAVKAGSMIETGALAPMAQSTCVRISRGELSVIDGPFAEAKEVVGGYAFFRFDSKQEAIESARGFMELHRKYWPGWEGETEVRQVLGPEDCAPDT